MLKLAILGIERGDEELCESVARMISIEITDLDIYDFSRSHKAGDEFDDLDFENVKGMLLEFRERFQQGSGQFDLGSLYKDRPTIGKYFN